MDTNAKPNRKSAPAEFRWKRAASALPSDWLKRAMDFADKVTKDDGGKYEKKYQLSARAIAAYIVAQMRKQEHPDQTVEAIEREVQKQFALNRSKKGNCTAYERAQAVVNRATLPQILDSFLGVGDSVYTLYDKFSLKYKPAASGSTIVAKLRQKDNEVVLEFVRLLSLESLHKAWRLQAALYGGISPDKVQPDIVKATRLNELWAEIERIKGGSVVQEPVAAEAATTS